MLPVGILKLEARKPAEHRADTTALALVILGFRLSDVGRGANLSVGNTSLLSRRSLAYADCGKHVAERAFELAELLAVSFQIFVVRRVGILRYDAAVDRTECALVCAGQQPAFSGCAVVLDLVSLLQLVLRSRRVRVRRHELVVALRVVRSARYTANSRYGRVKKRLTKTIVRSGAAFEIVGSAVHGTLGVLKIVVGHDAANDGPEPAAKTHWCRHLLGPCACMTTRLRVAPMDDERKTSIMISARLPTVLVERLDYVTRNIDSEVIKNRSAALRSALDAWLPGCEDRLRELGVLAKVRK